MSESELLTLVIILAIMAVTRWVVRRGAKPNAERAAAARRVEDCY
jgi:cbb3-type cytochrome oxidase subunit 3